MANEPTTGVPSWQEDPPAGARRQAFDREPNGGEPDPSDLGDRHAAGTPGGGDETGGLAGSNIGDGDALNPDAPDDEPAYGGPSGGAVGGTPAQGRAEGGHVYRHEFTTGGQHRGDSTVGADPDKAD
jgi:hypothetical protein